MPANRLTRQQGQRPRDLGVGPERCEGEGAPNNSMSSRYGRTTARKCSGVAGRLRCTTASPALSRMQTYIERVCRSIPQLEPVLLRVESHRASSSWGCWDTQRTRLGTPRRRPK